MCVSTMACKLVLLLLTWGVQAQIYNDPYVFKPEPQWSQPSESFNYPVRPPVLPDDVVVDTTVFRYDVATNVVPVDKTATPLYGGIIDGPMTLEKAKSPYSVREDVIIGPKGLMEIEPGVVIKFAPMVGMTVRGILNVKGVPNNPVVLTSADQPSSPVEKPQLRLVDGPSVLTGRVQIYHKGQWRAVCTNSRNWTVADMETACRQLGFQGGSWWGWVDREKGPSKPRLLLQEPRCSGLEATVYDCQGWNSRQLGAGVCDYHPDLGLNCLPNHAGPRSVHHWRGLKFENALYEKRLRRDNTLFEPVSQSSLQHVEIYYAGAGRDYNTTSALETEGVPPTMIGINIAFSAYNGINISDPTGPVHLSNTTVRLNRGYGIFVNSSYGDVAIRNSVVTDNGADGVRFIRSNPRLDDKFDRTDVYDFCMFPTTISQTYPVSVIMEQGLYNPTTKECSKAFMTKYGQIVTVDVVAVQTDRNDSAVIEIYDGASESDRLLAHFSIRNHTKLQSVTTDDPVTFKSNFFNGPAVRRTNAIT